MSHHGIWSLLYRDSWFAGHISISKSALAVSVLLQNRLDRLVPPVYHSLNLTRSYSAVLPKKQTNRRYLRSPEIPSVGANSGVRSFHRSTAASLRAAHPSRR